MEEIIVYFAVKYKGDWESIYQAISKKERVDMDEVKKTVASLKTKWVTIISKDYPNSLKQIPKPPFVLFYKGNFDLLFQKSIAVIGSRNATKYGISACEKIVKDLANLEDSFERGKLLRDGVSVAIVGKPNAGKSSLLNRILKEERAIVTDIEGTTRDTIEEFVNIKGITFKIIDTAGIRKADNEIEKIGIDKSRKALREADLIIAIFDVSKELSEEDLEILKSLKDRNSIILLNKKDLKVSILKKEKLNEFSNNILEVSVKENEGIEELYDKMAQIFNVGEIDTENTSIITNIRHKQAIKNAKDSASKAIEVINNMMPVDITAIYFKQAVEEINKITGENVTEDIINEIFSKFCLGK